MENSLEGGVRHLSCAAEMVSRTRSVDTDSISAGFPASGSSSHSPLRAWWFA